MAVTNSVNQINYTGKGNLDSKMNAVEDLDELLETIPRKERAVGMTVPVLNADGDGIQYDYWLVGGTADSNWEKKGLAITGNDVEI